jgi:hypothetical protein
MEPQQDVIALPGDRGHSPPSCLFDADCPGGSTCMKTSANAPGVCVRRR